MLLSILYVLSCIVKQNLPLYATGFHLYYNALFISHCFIDLCSDSVPASTCEEHLSHKHRDFFALCDKRLSKLPVCHYVCTIYPYHKFCHITPERHTLYHSGLDRHRIWHDFPGVTFFEHQTQTKKKYG